MNDLSKISSPHLSHDSCSRPKHTTKESKRSITINESSCGDYGKPIAQVINFLLQAKTVKPVLTAKELKIIMAANDNSGGDYGRPIGQAVNQLLKDTLMKN